MDSSLTGCPVAQYTETLIRWYGLVCKAVKRPNVALSQITACRCLADQVLWRAADHTRPRIHTLASAPVPCSLYRHPHHHIKPQPQPACHIPGPGPGLGPLDPTCPACSSCIFVQRPSPGTLACAHSTCPAIARRKIVA